MARRILLADDSVTAQNMGRRILTDAGYEVITVNNGSAALKKIGESKPDLIVLDVYMPGYGGLEVCQRVKESSETRQIPVLLTVGKLEPFKAEEARRVGADSFIVKPFEATELLTVLTKLEDKIVAQPQPQKSGRFAKVLAAVEQSDKGDRFGDKETGWKNRLTIPVPQAKPRTEEEAPETIAATPRGLEPFISDPRGAEQPEAVKPPEPSREFERPIPAGLPVDITPEEIAAITAAAAAFGGKTEQPAAIPETTAQDHVASQEVVAPEAGSVQPSEAEAPVATQESAKEAIQEVQTEARTEGVLEVVASAESVTAKDGQVEEQRTDGRPVEEHTTVAELPKAAANSEVTTSPEIQTSEPAQPTAGDVEVMAAIASLAPTNSHTLESVQPEVHGSNGTGHELPAAAYDSAAAGEVASGPRWIVEPVEIGLDESKLALDQEMEQAHAARASEAASLAAATAVASSSAVAVVEPVEPVAAAEVKAAEPAAATEPVPAVVATEVNAVESKVVETKVVESRSVEATTAQDHGPAVVAEGSAFAAAASVGAVTEHAVPTEAVSATTTAPQASATGQVESAQREAELAAAWQNWKQIRESFVGSQPASAAADAPAELSAKQEETAVPAQSAPANAVAGPVEVEEAAADAPEESTTIASIVDNMLAELRPKLVEEIARKMNSEKKEKDKKKRK